MKKFLVALALVSLGGVAALTLPSGPAPAELSESVAPSANSALSADSVGLAGTVDADSLAGSVGLAGSAPTVEYAWPSGAEVPVLRPFAPGPNNWDAGHRGVDLAIAAGQPVYAAASGRVIYAGKLNDRDLVSIGHADGIRTTYEPLSPAVTRGDTVTRGQLIGHLTGEHCAPSSCLHWGAKRATSDYLDPLSLLWGPIMLVE